MLGGIVVYSHQQKKVRNNKFKQSLQKENKNVLKYKKRLGFCKTSFRSFSEVLPFFTYIYYLSTFISHLIIYICRLDILFKKHFYFLSVNSNFKPPSC